MAARNCDEECKLVPRSIHTYICISQMKGARDDKAHRGNATALQIASRLEKSAFIYGRLCFAAIILLLDIRLIDKTFFMCIYTYKQPDDRSGRLLQFSNFSFAVSYNNDIFWKYRYIEAVLSTVR